MNIQELLTKIRPIWLHRVSHNLVSGAGVRENFETEIIKFYDALEQAIVTGNPGWLDPILFDWTNAPTQTELEQAQNNVSLLLNKMIVITNEIAGETLSEKEALTLLLAIIPLYTYGLEKSARYEIEARVAYISHQLDEVQNKLKRLDVSKSNFISVAAHELKTPITLI